MQKLLFFPLTLLFMQAHAQETPSTPKHFSHTIETTASPEKIWTIWTDVANWQVWDTGLKNAAMTEPFAKNAKGEIISLEGRKSKFTVIAYEQGKTYTFKTQLPLGGLYVKRYWEVKNGKTFFTHEVWFSGLTGGIFAKKFGTTFQKMLPDVMLHIKEIAEKP